MLTNAGKFALAMRATGQVPNEAFDFCLYTNDVIWTPTTTIGDMIEAAWTSYARQSITNGNWNAPSLDGSANAVSQANQLASFANGTGSTQTAKGFFVVGHLSGVFYGGDAFATPLAITAGQTVSTYPLYYENTL